MSQTATLILKPTSTIQTMGLPAEEHTPACTITCTLETDTLRVSLTTVPPHVRTCTFMAPYAYDQLSDKDRRNKSVKKLEEGAVCSLHIQEKQDTLRALVTINTVMIGDGIERVELIATAMRDPVENTKT